MRKLVWTPTISPLNFYYWFATVRPVDEPPFLENGGLEGARQEQVV